MQNEGKQPVRIIAEDGEDSDEIVEMEITEEPFVQHKTDPNIAGYPEEIQRKRGEYNADDFDVVQPKGMIFLIAKKTATALLVFSSFFGMAQGCAVKVQTNYCEKVCAAGTYEVNQSTCVSFSHAGQRGQQLHLGRQRMGPGWQRAARTALLLVQLQGVRCTQLPGNALTDQQALM
jgi:hypothetical protein